MKAIDQAEIIVGFLMIVIPLATLLFMSVFAIFLFFSLFLTISVYGGIGRNFENSYGGLPRNFETLRNSYNAKAWGDRY